MTQNEPKMRPKLHDPRGNQATPALSSTARELGEGVFMSTMNTLRISTLLGWGPAPPQDFGPGAEIGPGFFPHISERSLHVPTADREGGVKTYIPKTKIPKKKRSKSVQT